MEDTCLGLAWLGSCAYHWDDPPPIYFSIGHLMPAIALLLAFTQLASPITRFRLKTKRKFALSAATMYAVAIISVFIAAFLSIYDLHAVPLLGFAIFWEILAGLLFVSATIIVVWTMTRPAIFNRFNYKRYFREVLQFLEAGDDQTISLLSEELYYSMENVIKACKTFQEKGERDDQEYFRYAMSLLTLLVNDKFCQMLVTRTPTTAIKIVEELVNQQYYGTGARSLVKLLLKNAFTLKDSFMHLEFALENQEYFVVKDGNTFLDLTYGNYNFLDSIYFPLRAWDVKDDKDLENWKIQNYMRLLQMALRAYFHSKRFDRYPAPINRGLQTVTDIVEREALVLRQLSYQEARASFSYRNLMDVRMGLMRLLDIVQRKSKKLPDYEFNADNYNDVKDFSIYGVLAKGVFGFIQNLALMIEQDTLPVEQEALLQELVFSLWKRIYCVEGSAEYPVFSGIQVRLNIHLLAAMKAQESDQPTINIVPLVRSLVAAMKEEEQSPHLAVLRD